MLLRLVRKTSIASVLLAASSYHDAATSKALIIAQNCLQDDSGARPAAQRSRCPFLISHLCSQAKGQLPQGWHSCMAEGGGLYNERGEVPRLGEAARRCDLKALRDILSAGVDVDHPNSPDRHTALQLCSGKSQQYGGQETLEDRIACVEFLLANGASPNAGAPGNPGQGTYSTNLTPLMQAAYHAQVEIVELLLSAGADVNVILDEFDEEEEEEEGGVHYSALAWATSACTYTPADRARCHAVIEAMIRAGADANPPEWHETTVMQRVIMDRRRRIWPVLLRAGAILPTGDVRRNGYRIYAHRAHPYLQKIETAGSFKAHEKAHRARLLATFTPKFTHLVPEELVPLIVEFSFHVGFY